MNDIEPQANISRSILGWIILYLKGMAMGAADIVPGVSGGTVAFISGIYTELIYSLKACNPLALRVLFKQGFGAFMAHINARFLFVLLAGIATSLVVLVKVLTWLIAAYPQILWSFFFGLVLASAWLLSKNMEGDRLNMAVWLMLGAVMAWWISSQAPQQLDLQTYHFFFAGSVAICAMVLPGISGSFLLLLMGAYFPLLTAIDARDYLVLCAFAGGCVFGLLSFVHFLSWLLATHKNATFSVLVGFLLGSLKLLWPWKDVKEISVADHVKTYTINVSPQTYADLGVHPALEGYCFLAFLCALLMVVGLYFLSEKSL
ncbi:MAG: DUF368 domain-containing protein [Pseudomonadota bacterium]